MSDVAIDRIKAEVVGEMATLFGPFPFTFVKTINALAGRKTWQTSNQVRIQATPGNIRILKAADQSIDWVDKTGDLKRQEEFESLLTQHSATPVINTTYEPKVPLFEHQKKAVAISAYRNSYALLWEMGLGKTAALIANAGVLWADNKLTGVLIIAPKGVHDQWLEEQLPTHYNAPYKAVQWRKKDMKAKDFLPATNEMVWFSINIDAIRTPKGKAACDLFLATHAGKVMLIVDESHNIKDWKTLRTKVALELGKAATYRRIATGTPIAKNIIDSWTQFNFLDKNILGYKYVSAFRSRFCIMGGWEGKQIIGQKNTEEFYTLIAPHAYRMTKEEALDLPPKVYVAKEYEMGPLTAEKYKEVKDILMTELDDGSILDVANGAVAIGRLQQIVCGHLPREDGSIMKLGSERFELLEEIVEQRSGPIVIWHRFIADGDEIMYRLNRSGESAVRYVGIDNERSRAKEKFLSGEARCFVSNPKTGGVGLNLQGDCQTVIYFSNSFDAVDRWQSEDRVHRTGMKAPVTYFDIVARKSVDRLILRNLRTKKSISDLTLDEIRKAIKES